MDHAEPPYELRNYLEFRIKCTKLFISTWNLRWVSCRIHEAISWSTKLSEVP